MCQKCGNSGCGGKCKKGCVRVYKPTRFVGGQTGIPGAPGEPGEPGEPGPPGPAAEIPNDDWVVFSDADPEITSFDVNAGITTHFQEVQVAYKPIAYDAALVKVKARINVTIPNDEGFNLRDVDRLLSFDFILADIPVGGSNWFPTETGTLTALFPDLLGDNFGVPVSILLLLFLEV
jgi:hypothetical protein